MRRSTALLLAAAILFSLFPILSLFAGAAEQWLWPAEDCYIISSNYGLRDLYGTGSFTNYHYGIDIVGASSTYGMPVRAAKSGTVYSSCNTIADNTYVAGSCGNYVAIDHGDGTYSIYMHMRPNGVKTSGSVRQGETIGYIGNTGDSYGAHLHFEMYTNPNNRHGSTLNPMPTNSNITIRNTYVLPSGWPSTKTTYIFETESVPQNPKVLTDKTTYTLGETVTITPSADEATGYNVSVWLGAFGTGERVYGNYNEFTGSTTFKPTKTGVYTVRASCINSAGYSDAECMFRVVLPAYKVSFDTNGGTLESDASATRTVDGFNTGRPTGTLIVFNLSGEIVNTNSYGVEVAVNSNGQVVSKRNYGDESQLTVPDDGFVLSGHVDSEGCGGNFVKDIEIGDYVAYSESLAKAYVYKNYNNYLAAQKYVSADSNYGSLPEPHKDGYYFKGWYLSNEDAYAVNYLTNYKKSYLYARWDAAPVPVASIEYNNHKYELYDYHMPWTEAEAFCEARGGHLVTITDAAEQEKVLTLAQSGSFCTYAIGCTDAETEGTWKWVTGEAFHYQNWDSEREPSNGAGENYAHILTVNYGSYKQIGEWNDVEDTLQYGFYGYLNGGFICEYDAVCEHEYSYSETKEPTCTEQGYTTHTCITCGESYVDSYVSALGHAWDSGKVTTQPTETTAGVKTFTCTRCGETKTESIPATGGQPDQPDQPDQPGKPCDGGANCPSAKFVDVSAKNWFHEAVDFAVERGLFGGTSANTFESDTPMTRAMLVTVLWRYEGEPEAPANTFSDVKAGTWYSDAVSWASANGVVNGVGYNKFDPDGNITREQMATILYRYCAGKGIDTSKQGSLSGFPDAGKVSSYAQTALQWIVAEGIIGGSDGKLMPQGNATRAQVATILMRFIENIA